ncbi:MetS family NSS transporter small subunit [Acidobacteriota bacterium]
MKASGWIMLVVGCLILYGGLAYCLAVAMGFFRGGAKKDEAGEGKEE